MRMTKRPLNLLVDEDLIKQARHEGIVISRFLERKLEEHFAFMSSVSKQHESKCGYRDSNPGDRLGKPIS